MQPEVNVRLPQEQPQSDDNTSLIVNEKPCFIINNITLIGEEAARFQFALTKALQRSHFIPGMCLGSKAVNQIMTRTQNVLIARGYTTTRILASPQDLNNGTLQLNVIPG
ncbi:MAG: ShlB/FhaC/HecB family hemolysin secretion/activation protein, partial [Snodgrassella sp.]|nr:ShlB/FhaC/HecB family hemolysin secretion/activation protein [Snodgrassella sp.]